MTKSSGIGDNLYIQGVDVSGDTGSIQTIRAGRAVLDVTAINASGVERITGRSDGEIAFNTWFNDAAGESWQTLKALPTTNVIVTYCRGTTLGNPAAGLVAKQINHDGTEGADGSLAWTAQCLAAAGTPLEWGTQITAGKVTHASATNSTGEVTAQSTLGGIGYLQVFSVATGTPTFVLQHSSDTTNGTDGTWSNALVFTTTAAGAERSTVTGTIQKGLRIRTFGTFTNAVFEVFFRRGIVGDDVSLA